MDYKVIWSDAAISDLYEICSYIAKSDIEAAQRIGESILGHAQVLESFPFIGRSYPRGGRIACVKSSIGPTAFSTMSPNTQVWLRFCTYGIARGMNRRCRPQLSGCANGRRRWSRNPTN